MAVLLLNEILIKNEQRLIWKTKFFQRKLREKLKLKMNKNYYFPAYLRYINKTSVYKSTGDISLCL